jgi:hypothetical protein
MLVRNVLTRRLCSAWYASTWYTALCVTVGGSAMGLLPSQRAMANPLTDSGLVAREGQAIAQVGNADSPCYLHSPEGVQYDLRALCAEFSPPEGDSIVLQTGDIQVTLRWATADDLDLYVRDPFGDEVFFANPSVPSGGQLDVDANAGCQERMAEPVENIFWPTGGGAPGNYEIRVELFSPCGTAAPVPFTLTTLIQGTTQTQSGSVSEAQPIARFPFTFSSGGTTPAAASPDATAPTAPSGAAPTLSPPVLPVVPMP